MSAPACQSETSSLPSTDPILVAAVPHQDTESLANFLAEEMSGRRRAGDQVRAEEILAAHPEVWRRPAAAVRVVYEEVCLRQELGGKADARSVFNRFPQWRAELELLLDCHQLLGPGEPPVFPAVGEMLFDFRLVAELGRGALGRVFLAEQESLAGRPVVLKLICAGYEHLSLARLQHTQIVPLLFVYDIPERNLRLLCMPFFGGATLAQIATYMRVPGGGKPGNRWLFEILAFFTRDTKPDLPHVGLIQDLLTRLDFVSAVCWIGSCLADALQYAHERNLVHFDVKPSNVLIAADGQPMLLDFHLARALIHSENAALDHRMGGTPLYMSPEQRAALMAIADGRSPPHVDGRSDVYSLGMVLFELLGGELPLPPHAGPPVLSSLNSDVSRGLQDVLRRCLEPDPKNRYRAGELADDLRRHLSHLPLRGVSNRSVVERLRKWRRREPAVLTKMLLSVAVLIVAAGMIWSSATRVTVERKRRAEEAVAALREGREAHAKGDLNQAVRTLERGLQAIDNLSDRADLRDELERELAAARLAQARTDLHRVVEQLRFLQASENRANVRDIHARSSALWQEWMQQAAQMAIGSDRDTTVHDDLTDLGLIIAELGVRRADPQDRPQAHEDALTIIARVEALFGPSLLLHQERYAHAEALGLTQLAAAARKAAHEATPRTAWERYALGRSYLRAGDLDLATKELNSAVEIRPNDFWAHFTLATCRHRQGRLADAVAEFDICIALAPESAECYFNRALALAGLGRTEGALRDYTRCLQINPGLGSARLNRGIMYFERRELDKALVDLRLALLTYPAPAKVYFHIGLVQAAQGDVTSARASAAQALRHKPDYPEARKLLRSLPSGTQDNLSPN